MTETVILPDSGALKEVDLEPKFDPWAGIERLRLGDTDDMDFQARPRWPLDPNANNQEQRKKA